MQVPVPTVGKHERTLVREMPFAGFYRVVTRYGYMDEVLDRPLLALACCFRPQDTPASGSASRSNWQPLRGCRAQSTHCSGTRHSTAVASS